MGNTYQTFFSEMNFTSVLSGLIDIMTLRSGPNSCCQQNLKCFDVPLLLLGLFAAMTVKVAGVDSRATNRK